MNISSAILEWAITVNCLLCIFCWWWIIVFDDSDVLWWCRFKVSNLIQPLDVLHKIVYDHLRTRIWLAWLTTTTNAYTHTFTQRWTTMDHDSDQEYSSSASSSNINNNNHGHNSSRAQLVAFIESGDEGSHTRARATMHCDTVSDIVVRHDYVQRTHYLFPQLIFLETRNTVVVVVCYQRSRVSGIYMPRTTNSLVFE